ncbi:MAG: response regulator transcription factor [Bacteroidetes bacterium]|nr:response regulator transcription factor [Bacteroidota bacterium]
MKAILIDDEQDNQILLSSLLTKHCPQVEIIGIADSADSAYRLICDTNPDVIFLDINMPEKTGFDLLRLFDEINFSVIFVTGFDEYAIKAFEFNAVDYVLKPIDHLKLIKAVKKAEKQLDVGSKNLIRFVHSLEEKTNYVKKIMIHGNDKVHIIDLNDIVYITAHRVYSEILDVKQQHYISAKPLGDYAELLERVPNFIRVNKSCIINVHHVNSYTKGQECIILMQGSSLEIEVSRRKKTEIISILKSHE